METWDIVLLVVAGYVATFGLARLMARRREQLFDQFRDQMEQGQSESGQEQTEEVEPPTSQAA